jgi:hypothetical protein
MFTLIVDVESVPSMHPDAKAEVRAGLKPPGTLKRADSIATWWQTEADAAVEAEWRRQALDPSLGELIAIGVCTDCDREWVRCRRPGESEAQLLRDFFGQVEQWEREAVEPAGAGRVEGPFDAHTLVGHCLAFDTGFLWKRSRILGVPVPAWLPAPMQAKPGRLFVDTAQEWAGWGQRISLDRLCRALKLPSPKAGGMDGSQVLDAWLSGESERIATYCMADVRATREILHILRGWPRAAA